LILNHSYNPRALPPIKGVTKRLRASLFKSGGGELKNNKALGGTTKNGRLLAIGITSPGRAIWHAVRAKKKFSLLNKTKRTTTKPKGRLF